MPNAGLRSLYLLHVFNPITVLWDNDDEEEDGDSHFTDKETEAKRPKSNTKWYAAVCLTPILMVFSL